MPEHLAALIPESVRSKWLTLGTYDRRHLVAVAADLEAAGYGRQVVLAGLLHDIGKAGRVTILDRVAHVLLRRLVPGLRDRLAARSRPPLALGGLHLLVRHAEIGAEVLERAGVRADIVWLVRQHEDPTDDPDLCALLAADQRH